MHVLGPENVSLPGEPARQCRLMTPADFLAAGDRFDVTINVDSLTEMSADTAHRYMTKIAEHSDIFISINHECNEVRIADLLRARVDRSPCWIRSGYVDEIAHFDRLAG